MEAIIPGYKICYSGLDAVEREGEIFQNDDDYFTVKRKLF